MDRVPNQGSNAKRLWVVLDISSPHANICHRSDSHVTQPQLEAYSTQTGRPRPTSFPTPLLFTEHRFKIHNAMGGTPANRLERFEVWLDDVVDAMENGELEDPYSPKDPPEDRMGSRVLERNVGYRRSPLHLDAWGNPSER